MKDDSWRDFWERLPHGGAVFIPCLDPEAVLKDALTGGYGSGEGVPVGKTGIYKGQHGVMLYRLPNGSSLQAHERALLPSLTFE